MSPLYYIHMAAPTMFPASHRRRTSEVVLMNWIYRAPIELKKQLTDPAINP